MRNSCDAPVYFDYVDEDDPFADPSQFLRELLVLPSRSLEILVLGEDNGVDVRLYASVFPGSVLGPRYQLEGEFVIAGDDCP